MDILNAQLALKNKDIDHLLEEISNLRHINREKLKGLGNVNASEQNALNNEISVLKQSLLRLKGSLHETEEKLADQAA